MLVHRRVTPSIKFAGTHLYTWVERGTVRVKCLAQEHNTMSPARARTRTARSEVERTNHEATAYSFPIAFLYSQSLYFCPVIISYSKGEINLITHQYLRAFLSLLYLRNKANVSKASSEKDRNSGVSNRNK